MTTLLGLDLAGLAVVIAGAGDVAGRRARHLSAHGASVTCVAPRAGETVARLAAAGEVAWIEREARAADLDDAWLAVAATESDEANAAVARWARERRIFCINSGSAGDGTARVPATGEAAGLALAVASVGEPDPARAARVRDALLAAVDAGDVDVRRGRAGGGEVLLVGAGPGDPRLHTVGLRHALRCADVIVADRLGTEAALALAPDDVEVVDVGKAPGRHARTQEQINALLVERALAGQRVVRLKGGDPFVFGRGGEEVHACLAAGVRVEVLPGVTSAFSVPALAGIPVTQRGVARSVLVTSGHDGAAPEALAAMAAGATVCILMGVGHLESIADAALAAGVDPATPVAVVESGSTADQRVTRAELATISVCAAETGVKPPAVIVVGAVAQPDLFGSEVARTPRGEVNGDDTRQ